MSAYLFQLGAVTIKTVGPFNATDTTEDFGADYAVKPIVGVLQDREFMGPADGCFTISGTLFPYFFRRAGKDSGLSEIEVLRSMTNSGKPQKMVRGDGINLGNWLVEKVSQKSSHLSTEGIGKVITYDISLVKTKREPDPLDQVQTLHQVIDQMTTLYV